MNDNLQFDLELNIRLDRIDQQLQGVSNRINSRLADSKAGASNIGAQVGQAFGQSLTSLALKFIAVDAIVGVMRGIISAQIGLAQDAFRISQQNQKAETGLAFSIKAANEQAIKRNSILKDENASYEQKAKALGISNDKMYEEVKASKAAGDATKGLEAQKKALENQIQAETRAFEDQTKAINDNIKKLQQQTQQQIEQVRARRGFNDLTQNQKTQQDELLDLQIAQIEAQKNGDAVTAFLLDQQIKQKQLDLSLTDKKIEKIERETDVIENLAEVEIKRLRAELDASKNVFEINTEPARRAVEDLQNQISNTKLSIGGGGSTFKPKQDILDAIAKEKVAPPKILNEADIKGVQQRIFEQTKGLIPKGAISGAIDDLILSGLSNTTEIEQILNRFVDISVKSTEQVQGPYNQFGNALGQLSEQFRTQRAELGETAGLTQEYGLDIIPAGIAKLTEMKLATGELQQGQKLNFDTLTEGEQAQAKYLGLLEVTTNRQGAFKNELDNGNLAAEEFQASIFALKEALGKELGPEIKNILKEIAPLVKEFTQFISTNEDFKELLKDIFGVFKDIIKLIKDNKDTIKSVFEFGFGAQRKVNDFFGFSEGGYTGNMPTNKVAGVVHGQEFVIPADLYKQYRPLIDAIYSRSATPSISTETNTNMETNYYNYGANYTEQLAPALTTY